MKDGERINSVPFSVCISKFYKSKEEALADGFQKQNGVFCDDYEIVSKKKSCLLDTYAAYPLEKKNLYSYLATWETHERRQIIQHKGYINARNKNHARAILDGEHNQRVERFGDYVKVPHMFHIVIKPVRAEDFEKEKQP